MKGIFAEYERKEEGFSLLETLIALAILSVISLATFQSTLQLLAVSQKSVNIANKTVDDYVFRQSFRNLVRGLAPGWESQEELMFKGDSQGFSGLTSGISFTGASTLSHVSVTLDPIDNRHVDLRLMSDDENITLTTFLADNLRFSYMDWNQQWYEKWPPNDVPPTGFYDDHKYIDLPQMPTAIRLSREAGSFSIIASRNQPSQTPITDASFEQP